MNIVTDILASRIKDISLQPNYIDVRSCEKIYQIMKIAWMRRKYMEYL